MPLFLLAGLCIVLQQPNPPNPNLIGAKAAVRELSAKNPEASLELKETAFVERMEAFEAAIPKMDPKVAARGWLDLLDTAEALPRRQLQGAYSGPGPQFLGTLNNVFDALPEPEAWPEIDRLLSQRPKSRQSAMLRLLFARLQGKDDQIPSLIKEVLQAPTAFDRHYMGGIFGAIQLYLAERAGDLDGVTKVYLHNVDAPQLAGRGVCDLTVLLGPGLAAPIIEKMLENTSANSWPDIYGAAAQKLARKLARTPQDYDESWNQACAVASAIGDAHALGGLIDEELKRPEGAAPVVGSHGPLRFRCRQSREKRGKGHPPQATEGFGAPTPFASL